MASQHAHNMIHNHQPDTTRPRNNKRTDGTKEEGKDCMLSKHLLARLCDFALVNEQTGEEQKQTKREPPTPHTHTTTNRARTPSRDYTRRPPTGPDDSAQHSQQREQEEYGETACPRWERGTITKRTKHNNRNTKGRAQRNEQSKVQKRSS